jgi:hypothetical protein
MAIGINWAEVWVPVWKAVWAQSPPIPPTPDPVTGQTPAGSNRKRRYFLEIDGQHFAVANAAEAEQLLQQARALAERQVEKLADTAVKKLKRKTTVPVVEIPAPAVAVSSDLRAELAPIIADIERLYRQAAVTAEIRLRIALNDRRQRALDDDDEDVLLLI